MPCRRRAGQCNLRFVRDGEELFDYLRRRASLPGRSAAPRPDLILMDLKMPRKDGREALRELKADPHYRQIPVVALTTSTASDDVEYCYDAGVNAYITKPATFRELVEVLVRTREILVRSRGTAAATKGLATWWNDASRSCWWKTIPTTFG